MNRSDAVPRLLLVPLIFLLFGIFSESAADTPGASSKQPFYRQGELLVKFRAEAGRAAAAEQHLAVGAAVQRRLAAGDVELVRLPADMDMERALEQYRANPLVEYAEPNYLVHRARIPNDPRFAAEQWALDNTGQAVRGVAGEPGADIGAAAAWDLHVGDAAVVVAILDSGVDYGHPDLAANIWTNTDDPADGLDNDGNGFVDDIRGWNFVGDNNDPMDDDLTVSHGTHVAGIIGAVGDNAVGISGINWTVRMMPLKVLDSNGVGTLADIIAAMDYAVANGARVINASYTYPQSCEPLPFGASELEREAIARAHSAGVLLVAAAGNFGCDTDVHPFYPAAHRVANILSVAATDPRDRLADFSNTGEGSIHLGAPGINILSTIHPAAGEYGYLTGTSMAAPMVAGAAALVSAFRPQLEGKAVRELILNRVTPLAALDGRVMSGGRLDLGAAMTGDLALEPPFRPAYLTATRRSATRIDLAWLDNSAVEDRFELERRVGRRGGYEVIADTLPANTESYSDTTVELVEGSAHFFRVRAANGNGRSGYSNEAAIVMPPNAPANLTVQLTAAGAVDLTWVDNSAIEDGFEIERQAEGGPFSVIATVGPNVVRFTDETAEPSVVYVYRVRAFDAASGHSDYATSAPVVVATQTAGGNGGGSGCFIATAAYGSELHPKVALLRRFRDEYLLPTRLGRALVHAYYRISPPLARLIAAHEPLRAAVRAGLTPIVWAAELALSRRPPEATPARKASSDSTQDEILVKFRKDVPRARAEAIIRAHGAAVERYMASAGIYVVSLPRGASVAKAVESFAALPEVERAEPNVRVGR